MSDQRIGHYRVFGTDVHVAMHPSESLEQFEARVEQLQALADLETEVTGADQ